MTIQELISELEGLAREHGADSEVRNAAQIRAAIRAAAADLFAATYPRLDLGAIATQLAPAFDSVAYEDGRADYICAEGVGGVWCIGTNNGPLGADYYASAQAYNDGEPSHSIDIPITDTAPDRVANAILAALAADEAKREACAADGHDFDSAQNLDGGRCRKCGVRR